MGYGSAGTCYVGSDLKANTLRYAWAICDGNPGVMSLSKTGQTATYSSGDDGDLGKGVVWPSPRFLDNGNGTVTDLLTGLMWQKFLPLRSRLGRMLLDGLAQFPSPATRTGDCQIEGNWGA
jgi:hypothetical protein